MKKAEAISILKQCKFHLENVEFLYMMLSRMKSDCKFFLGWGNRDPQHLWAGDVSMHINIMRALYEVLPAKPEWLTEEQLNDFAAKMCVK